jgi:hypothetical protein
MVMRESTVWRWSHTRHHSDTIIVGRDPEIAVPELGPLNSGAVGYGLSCFPPSWDDAKVLRVIIDRAWRKALAKHSLREQSRALA